MNLPLVSIIIPTVRRPQRLWQALESVASQEYLETEVIVVNDAGVAVGDLVEQYRTTFGKSALYVNLPINRRLAGARNAGIAAASGSIIALLDDDDRFMAAHLAQTVAALIDNSNAVLAYDDVLIQLEGGTEDDTAPIIIGDCRFGRPYDPQVFATDDFIPPSAQVFWRKEWEAIGGFDEYLPICEDWDFLLRLRERGDFLYVPDELGVIYSYRVQSGDNLSSNFGSERQQVLDSLSARYHLPPLVPKTFLDVARDLGFTVTLYDQQE